jgi:hypothetical protein
MRSLSVAVAKRPPSLCGQCRHATAVATGPPSLFIFRALSAMMQAEMNAKKMLRRLSASSKPESG